MSQLGRLAARAIPRTPSMREYLRFHRSITGPFTTTIRPTSLRQAHSKPLPPRPTIDESTITEAFLKGTGPGGQKINKTSSAVQLKHLPTGIVIKCQETRSRSQNRKIARRILAERIEERELGEGSRTAIKAERLSKKKASRNKKSRRKYKKLADEGKEEDDDEDVEDNGEGEGIFAVDRSSEGRILNSEPEDLDPSERIDVTHSPQRHRQKQEEQPQRHHSQTTTTIDQGRG
ncbi:hypothetical protein AAFC00_005287 [Neodothiora populina]|uniref:Prokaryotic-type class I peptide chain release factors domain-containing protein n=1 Tax=Neodothiora populina TaxID=2781224 RepID=A0ABR3PKR1_9PEZI